jgi:glycosyltransferase involved in cell wall biosynthesis
VSPIRISLFVHDLHSNPIVRAAPIGLALKRLGFNVEVLGLVPRGKSVYPPYAHLFEYKTIEVRGRVVSHSRELANLASGDLFYAFKPLRTTLLPASIASSVGLRGPLLLDIEDDDLRVCEANLMTRAVRTAMMILRNPLDGIDSVTHQLRRFCHATTVSSRSLKRFYGGTQILHGPDELRFNPDLLESNTNLERDLFGLPHNKFLVLFAGGPSFHKGFDLIVDAVYRTSVHLVLAGNAECSDFRKAKDILGDRCHLLGLVDNEKMPRLLQAVDVVPVPQRDVAYARAQLPAKLIEAMAMGKAIICSRVGDLPHLILGDQNKPRGWIIPPDDAQSLARAILEISQNSIESRIRSRNARDFFVENASVSRNTEIFREMFQKNRSLRKFLPK